MSLVTRMMMTFNAAGVPMFIGKEIVRRWPLDLTGSDILQCISDAQDQVDRLKFCIDQMIELVEGETDAERTQRIADEDANPEPAARAGGWMFEHELKAKLAADGEPYANWLRAPSTVISSFPAKQVVRLRKDGPLPTNEWPRTHQYFADYLNFADDWKDALAKVRKEAAEKRKKLIDESLA